MARSFIWAALLAACSLRRCRRSGPRMKRPVPKTADGKVDLNAPAPRTTDGKPDLSGIWMARAGFEPNPPPGRPPLVETNNYRGDGWLDARGSPITESATFTERFRRVNYGQLEIEFTLNDPKAYATVHR